MQAKYIPLACLASLVEDVKGHWNVHEPSSCSTPLIFPIYTNRSSQITQWFSYSQCFQHR